MDILGITLICVIWMGLRGCVRNSFGDIVITMKLLEVIEIQRFCNDLLQDVTIADIFDFCSETIEYVA